MKTTTKPKRILLSAVFGPYGVNDAYGRKENIMELFHNQVTKAQGPSSFRFFHRSFGLYFIAANVDAMFARGVVNEVAALADPKFLTSTFSVQRPGPTASQAIGLREIQALLRGEMTEPECRAAIVLATRRYAKRQLTWFRNQFNFPIIDLTGQRHHEALSSALNLLGAA